MIPLKWKLAIAAVILAAVGYWAYQWHAGNQRAEKANADLTAAEAVHHAFEQLKKSSARVDTVVDTLIVHEKAHAASAAKLKAASDTAGQHALTLRDTANMYHLRWVLARFAYDSLELAKADADSAVDSLRVDRNKWKAQATASDSVNQKIAADLKDALNDHCRILPFVPCLSRKETLVVGIIGGAVAMSNPKATIDATGKLLKKILTLGR